MKVIKNQTQDTFLKKAIQEVTPMSPGPDFLKKVMKKVEVLPAYQTSHVVYSPLITKKGWFIIVCIILGILIASFFTLSPESQTLPDVQRNIVASIHHFSTFFSQVFVLGMVVLTALFVVQIWLLTKGTKKLV